MTTPIPNPYTESAVTSGPRASSVAVIAAIAALVLVLAQQVVANLIPFIVDGLGIGFSQVPFILLPFVLVGIVLSLVAIIAGAQASRGGLTPVWNGVAIGIGASILASHVLGLVLPLLLQLL